MKHVAQTSGQSSSVLRRSVEINCNKHVRDSLVPGSSSVCLFVVRAPGAPLAASGTRPGDPGGSAQSSVVSSAAGRRLNDVDRPDRGEVRTRFHTWRRLFCSLVRCSLMFSSFSCMMSETESGVNVRWSCREVRLTALWLLFIHLTFDTCPDLTWCQIQKSSTAGQLE